MTLIVSDSGTYNWLYTFTPIPYHGTVGVVDADSLSFMSLAGSNSWSGAGFVGTVSNFLPVNVGMSISDIINAVRIAKGFEGSGTTTVVKDIGVAGDSYSSVPFNITAGAPFLVRTGVSYDTGTVQIYGVTFSEQTSAYNSPGLIDVTTYTNSIWIWYAPTTGVATPIIPPIPPDPPPTTLQVARVAPGHYVSQDSITLPKYSAPSGAAFIRAKFNSGTQIAVIKENSLGGFMIYEEVGGNPSGNVYIYNPDRTLNDVVDASQIGLFQP